MNESRIVAQKKNGKAIKQLNSREMKGNNPILKNSQNTINRADLILLKTRFDWNRCQSGGKSEFYWLLSQKLLLIYVFVCWKKKNLSSIWA